MLCVVSDCSLRFVLAGVCGWLLACQSSSPVIVDARSADADAQVDCSGCDAAIEERTTSDMLREFWQAHGGKDSTLR